MDMAAAMASGGDEALRENPKMAGAFTELESRPVDSDAEFRVYESRRKSDSRCAARPVAGVSPGTRSPVTT